MFHAVLFSCALLTASAFPTVVSRLFEPAREAAPPAFALSTTLGSNMVLQRAPQSATVWGFAAAGATVKTSFAGNSYSTTSGADGIWRQTLPPQPATLAPATLTFTSSTGEPPLTLANVLFGDVYICSGQSNMQFSVPAMTNSSAEANRANDYPAIRLFTVGQGTSSKTPLTDLKTVSQPWAVANNVSVSGGGSFGHFSAVCWIFGRDIFDGLGGSVPIGVRPPDRYARTALVCTSRTAALSAHSLTPLRPSLSFLLF